MALFESYERREKTDSCCFKKSIGIKSMKKAGEMQQKV